MMPFEWPSFLDVDHVETYVLKATGNVFRLHVGRKVTDYCLYRPFGIW